MEKYLVAIERAPANFSAYSPDVPGCVATGRTVEGTLAEFRAALAFHLEGLAADGADLPRPRGVDSYLEARRDTEPYLLAHLDPADVLPPATVSA